MGLDMMLNVKGYGLNQEAVYWRKASAIHNWFVKNVQNGVDDCGEYPVTTGELMQLVNTCKKVLADHSLAETLLPTTSGFFFGSTAYDDWYFDGLTYTVDSIEAALEKYTEEGTNFYYHSSW